MNTPDSAALAKGRPLTARQRMILIEDELHRGIPCNNVLTRLVIRGPVDPERFSAAYADVCQSFDALRLRVSDGARELVQHSTGTANPLEVVDLRTTEERDEAYAKWLQHRCRTAFRFDEPLADAALVGLGENHWVFYLNQHHSITDGMSCILLHDALERVYTGDNSREAPSFAEFLDDTSAYEASEQFVADKEFWTKRFATPPEPQRLYGQDQQRKEPLTDRYSLELPANLSQAVWEMTPTVPLSQVFATTLFAFLRVVTGSSDLSVGVPLLNRSESFRHSIGLLMEICPTRIRVDEHATFSSILASVRKQISEVRPHRRYPMSSRVGGYEVILNIHSESPSSFAGMPADYELTTPLNVLDELPHDGTGEDWGGRETLTVQIHHRGPDRRIVVSFDCNRGVFADPRMGRRAVEHFMAMLAGFVADREARIESVDLLTAEERAMLIPPEESAYARGQRPVSVVERFARQATRVPGALALVHRDVELTYRDLDSQVRRLAQVLRDYEVRPGDLVGICLERSPDLVAALLATMYVGAAYVPIDPTHPTDRIALILEDASPRLLIGTSASQERLGETDPERILLIDSAKRRIDDAMPYEGEAIQSEIAYVIFTSGSTGRPKGVRVRHHGLATFLEAMASEPGLEETDRLLAVTTVSFDIAALEFYLPLTIGAAVHIADSQTAMDGEALANLLTEADITVIQATPATYRILLQAGWAGKPDLRVLCGGEALSAELADALVPRVHSLWNMYGPTETTIWSTVHRVVATDPPISIGHPIRGTQTFVLNDDQHPVPIGVPGELYIAGDGVAEGYHGRPDLTAERFVPNPFSTVPRSTMYRTGDLVRVQQNGDLEYMMRADFQVKVRGFRIELGEIESVLEQHDQVLQAVVSTRRDRTGETSLVGYVVPATSKWDAGSVRDHLRHKLPTYMVPPIVLPVEEFPLTPNGKVDRKALPTPDETEVTENDREHVAPRSDLELRLAMIWEDVLGLSRVGIHDDFFDLGGHSMHAVQLTSRMREEFGTPIELGLIFTSPTIAKLAHSLHDAKPAGRTVVPLQRTGKGTPVFCLCGIGLYQGLVRSMGDTRPFYGLYIPEEEEIFTKAQVGEDVGNAVPLLADAYYSTIRDYHGTKPMNLLGFCFGGILAFEVARRAARDGIEVERLILIDTPLWNRMRQSPWKRLKHHVQILMARGPSYLVERIRARRRSSAGATTLDDAALDEDARIGTLAERARVYCPEGTYDGRVLFVRANDQALLATWVTTRLLGWESILTGAHDVIDVFGPHEGILNDPSVSEIAAGLGPLL